jgi:hypothetical protein
MILKKLLPFFLFCFTIPLFAADPATTSLKFYGYVGNDFFYNSRQNVELVDGVIQLFPKPISPNAANADVNATSQAELLSVNTRLGIDITGTPILGAKSSGKIEADFAGFGTTYYVFRIRQAFMKLNWDKTELLVGQTWHPLFGNVAPTTFSANAGGPFQPFNRSPQVRVKRTLTNTLSATVAALYEMQYASQGPNTTLSPTGTNPIYMKNALAPDLFVGLENKTSHWTSGAGIDFKTLKPEATNTTTISSLSAVAYTQYVNKKLQLKAKAIYGENLSDQLMIGGYGVSKYGTGVDSTKALGYTNYRNGSAWINAVYGTKLQVGLLLGVSQNLGSSDDLAINSKTKKFGNYGYGFYDNSDLNANLKKGDAGFLDQQILDRLYRIAPQVSYNLPNMKFGLEYDFMSASYGKLQQNGTAINNYTVNNHRILASVMYIF